MKRHGMYNTRIYIIWSHIKQRCYDKNFTYYNLYGGRGIKMCDEWFDDFLNFYNDVGNPPSNKHTIDRINNDGNYEPSNIRWATMKEQGNNRRNNVRLKYDGKEMTLSQWAKYRNINVQTLYARLHKYGWELGKSLNYE